MSTHGESPDRRGTFWDWPVAVMAIAVLLLFITAGRSAGASLVLVAFGAVALMARRGAFSPRK